MRKLCASSKLAYGLIIKGTVLLLLLLLLLLKIHNDVNGNTKGPITPI